MSVETLAPQTGISRDLANPLFFDPGLQCVRMSFDEYLQLPDKPKAEWLDGWAVIHVAPALLPHGRIVIKLGSLFLSTFPMCQVTTDAPLRLGNYDLYPDIMVYRPQPPGRKRLTEPPIVAVEILSPSTRRYDLTFKLEKYLAVGVQQYWTVDTDRQTIIVRENVGSEWREIAILDEAHPVITVDAAPHGTITLNRAGLFD